MSVDRLYFGTNLKMYKTASQTREYISELVWLTSDMRPEPIVYEPVWAIGVSGIPAEPAYVALKHNVIRTALRELYGKSGEDVPLLFGGSVNPSNACDYIVCQDVDGLFVGRAAWDAADFNALSRAVLCTWKEKNHKR